ncbi:hypothetical protein DE146DRAFT_638163 [Phaeosphaeria sp. MPI-PUGE-AT-0046c]|nr:hypothetical protein DE146DRAFT_638163 [Phaeosphaeria sp. MPI-PUGE-AT-0046c]
MALSPNHVNSVAIVGASGTIGSHIAYSLLSNPSFTIKALTRSGSTATFPSNVTVATVDHDEPLTIVSALRAHAVNALVITLSVSAPPSTQETLIRAAAQAGVKWVLPNEFGMYNSEAAQLDTVGDAKTRARKLIADLGMNYIGLTCGFWYEHSLSAPALFGIDIKTRNAVFFDDGSQKLNCSSWGFVGRAVARLLSLPISPVRGEDEEVTLGRYKNKMVFVASFAVSQQDMLASVQRVTNMSDAKWGIVTVDTKKRFEDAKEKVKNGDRSAFGRCLYTRYFYEDEGLFEKSHGLDNDALGLEREELDKATRRALEVLESGYWERYGKS